jgi:hypothetical protein
MGHLPDLYRLPAQSVPKVTLFEIKIQCYSHLAHAKDARFPSSVYIRKRLPREDGGFKFPLGKSLPRRVNETDSRCAQWRNDTMQ